MPFDYTALSFAKATRFSWVRDSVEGIENKTAVGQSSSINEVLKNITSQPKNVKYLFTLDVGDGKCKRDEELKVIVNPTPSLEKIPNLTLCNGVTVSGINFRSNSPNPSFEWKTDSTVGFGLSGKDSIPPFVATNTTLKPIIATVAVSITASTDYCVGPNDTFKITVNPSALKPSFTSLSRYPDSDTATFCAGSKNINFNVNEPHPGMSYDWKADVSPQKVLIQDVNHANSVVTFKDAGTFKITATATNNVGKCTSSITQIIKVSKVFTGTDTNKIFLMQPGNMLVYPNNTLDMYQWGADTILNLANNFFGPTIPIQGQVQQFFYPPEKFISGRLLNQENYLYSVLLESKKCFTRIYFNGPYANRVAEPVVQGNAIKLSVVPNPNSGLFTILLAGNIYGKVEAKVLNAAGQILYRKNFVKTAPEVYESFNTSHLPAGLYFLEVQSSDLKRVVSRFVIQY